MVNIVEATSVSVVMRFVKLRCFVEVTVVAKVSSSVEVTLDGEVMSLIAVPFVGKVMFRIMTFAP